MLMNTGKTPVYSNTGLLTCVGWKMHGKDMVFALDGGIYVAGSVITWMKDKMHLISDAKETGELAESVPDTAGVCFVPALTGLAAPYWDPYARGMLIGITPGTERAHVVRAALESIAYQVRDILDLMEMDSGIRIRAMRVDGGITANEFLMQFQADILGIPWMCRKSPRQLHWELPIWQRMDLDYLKTLMRSRRTGSSKNVIIRK